MESRRSGSRSIVCPTPETLAGASSRASPSGSRWKRRTATGRPISIGWSVASARRAGCRYTKRTAEHGVFTASLGLEYASGGSELDHELSFLLSSGYRGFFETATWP
jgi:hypothetical protein